MKDEQVVSEVFCWTRNPAEVRRLAVRKAEILSEILGPVSYSVADGVLEFLETLSRHDVPCAVAATEDSATVHVALEKLGLRKYISVVVGSDDVLRGRPDPTAYLYACQDLGRVPLRCAVVVHSNSCIEAAQDVGMKVIAVSSSRPAYELASADLVVRHLPELCLVNLKQLFSVEDLEPEPEPELELEEETFSEVRTQTLEVDSW
eukprot:CAMPEP_0196589168 /NCGR_PEP_ID=MMETSP1081-20130531/62890_1 /TAXON_ID=36882 /ORGANISM="Pyramimonas amylifera, Strain CCMP720" /LENGTH=204 /DNA_ID=CAMNT_0041911897 /DNA_START=996 /DNA_END=1610 /DNA_ORIENTATION=+